MFANSSLKEHSVINLDMIYKYILSSITTFDAIQTALGPYDSSLEDAIMEGLNNDGIYACPNRYDTSTGEGRNWLNGFTWHPGGDAPMDGRYGRGDSEGEKAGIMVEDSIALNPYINYGGMVLGGQITTTVYTRPTIDIYYHLEFKSGGQVTVRISYDGDSIEPNETYILSDGDFSVRYTSGSTTLSESQVISLGEIDTIEYGHRTISAGASGYSISYNEIDEGAVCLKRGNLKWKEQTGIESISYDDYVVEKDIVDSNFSGASTYNIGICICEKKNYEIYGSAPSTSMTFVYVVKMYDNSIIQSGATVGVELRDTNDDLKVSAIRLPFIGGQYTYRSGSTTFNKNSESETPYTGSWRVINGADYYIYSQTTTIQGNTVTSTGYLKPVEHVSGEYSVTLFTFTKRTYSNTHYVVFVTNDRSGVTKRLEGNFTDDSSSDQWGYDSKTTIMVKDGDTLTFEMGEDTAKWEDVAFQGGNLGGDGITNFPFVYATLGVVERGTNTTDTSPQIVGSTHFYDTGDAAIRIFMNFEP